MPNTNFIIKYFLFISFFAGIECSCNLINPHEIVPTYVHVDSFIMQYNSAVQPHPAITQGINNVWAYYNGTLIGVFDLPATIPIMAAGTGQLTLAPGISVDGLNSFLSVYPFYRMDTSTFTAQPGKIITREPVSSYYSASKVSPITSPYTSGFTPDSNATAVQFVSRGAGVYSIDLKNVNDSFESYTSQTYAIPLGVDAYLELDYNCTNTFYLGVQANLSGTGLVDKVYLSGVNTTNGQWKKFYLAVEDFVAQYKGTDYTFFIKSSLDPGLDSSQVLLRNIQLIHY